MTSSKVTEAEINTNETKKLARFTEDASMVMKDAQRFLTIRNPADYQDAVAWVNLKKQHRKIIVENFADPKAKTRAAWVAVCDLEKKALNSIDQGIQAVGQVCTAYDDKLEADRRAAERKLQQEADERARKEREKEIKAAEKQGDKQAVRELKKEPVYVPPVVVEKPKTEGATYREVWKADCSNLMELAKAVVAGTVPPTAIQANDKFLGEQARSLKALLKWPGVRVWSEKIMVGQ